jgi:hypothetical protein
VILFCISGARNDVCFLLKLAAAECWLNASDAFDPVIHSTMVRRFAFWRLEWLDAPVERAMPMGVGCFLIYLKLARCPSQIWEYYLKLIDQNKIWSWLIKIKYVFIDIKSLVKIVSMHCVDTKTYRADICGDLAMWISLKVNVFSKVWGTFLSTKVVSSHLVNNSIDETVWMLNIYETYRRNICGDLAMCVSLSQHIF